VFLNVYQCQLQNAWKRFKLFQRDLGDLDDEDFAQEKEALKEYFSLDSRVLMLMDENRSSTTPIPSHDTRGSLRDTRNVSPKCNLTTTMLASSVPQQPNSTVPNALLQTSSHVRCSSPTRDLTAIKFAASVSEQSESTPPNALYQTLAPHRLHAT
jgi:hypothetical protein